MDEEVLKLEKIISKSLVKLRKNKKLTQTQLGDQLGMSRSKVSSWEVGRRDLSVMDAIIISDFFQVSLDVLLNSPSINTKKIMNCMEFYIDKDDISYDEKYETLKQLEESLKEKELVKCD